jgi:hypothetical protein
MLEITVHDDVDMCDAFRKEGPRLSGYVVPDVLRLVGMAREIVVIVLAHLFDDAAIATGNTCMISLWLA